MYLTDNLRAFRTWGLSALCPWDHGIYWKLREGVKPACKELPTDWDTLQRPGFSPDYMEGQMEWMNLSYDRSDWSPTLAGQALIRNNQPLLAYIGGKPSAFTSKDHNFFPGDTVHKQIIVINNSRETVKADCRWSLLMPKPVSGRQDVTIETGQQARLPLDCRLSPETKPGHYELLTTVSFSNGQVQQDRFVLDVLPRPPSLHLNAKIALFDPRGETGGLLRSLGVPCTAVDSKADLSAFDLLIVGKGALTPDGPAPDIARVREGLKVILFEQTAAALEKRFGFRVAEYGLRTVFKRVPDHPLLGGIAAENLSDWRGEATLLAPRLTYEIGPRHAPQVTWCDIPETRVWRAGNRGSVASVLIEKPERGDFLSILDGGFGLQFSPLLEFREGRGLMLFCQMDVTARSESDPAADILVRQILQYASQWLPLPKRRVIYLGQPAGKRHLEEAGFAPGSEVGEKLPPDAILIVGPGGGNQLTNQTAAVAAFLEAGGNLLAVGLDESEANAFLPIKVGMKSAEHIAAFFEPEPGTSLLAGVGPADVHNRDPRILPLVSSGATIIGDGVLARAPKANLVFCQLAPWAFDDAKEANLRRTHRRTTFLLTRLLANMGASGSTPILERFHTAPGNAEKRWLDGLYLEAPQEWDDPYRFFCW